MVSCVSPAASHRVSHNCSPVQTLAEVEAGVPSLDAGACRELLGAAARLSAALAAHNLTLAVATAAITPEADLLDAKGAARRLGVSLPTIYRLVRQSQLTVIRVSADTLRFSPADLEEFVSARRAPDQGNRDR